MAKTKTKKTTKKTPAKKRARTKKGRFVGDDPTTPGNEAYEKSFVQKYWGPALALIIVIGVLILKG